MRDLILALSNFDSIDGINLRKRTEDAALFFKNRFSTERLLRDVDQIYREYLDLEKGLLFSNPKSASQQDHFNSLTV
jgi:hypothetical protein